MENSTIEKVDIRLSKEEIKMLETARSIFEIFGWKDDYRYMLFG